MGRLVYTQSPGNVCKPTTSPLQRLPSLSGPGEVGNGGGKLFPQRHCSGDQTAPWCSRTGVCFNAHFVKRHLHIAHSVLGVVIRVMAKTHLFSPGDTHRVRQQYACLSVVGREIIRVQ